MRHLVSRLLRWEVGYGSGIHGRVEGIMGIGLRCKTTMWAGLELVTKLTLMHVAQRSGWVEARIRSVVLEVGTWFVRRHEGRVLGARIVFTLRSFILVVGLTVPFLAAIRNLAIFKLHLRIVVSLSVFLQLLVLLLHLIV